MMTGSIANESEVVELATTLGTQIPHAVQNEGSSFAWTAAVWETFKQIADKKSWKLYPGERPYKGEYLLDFVLWEANYGPRIACESQWQHRCNGIDAIDWAFDKLRCVKGDIKILIYEWPEEPNGSQPPDKVSKVIVPYLKDLALLSSEEAFLLLNFYNKRQSAHWWKPVNPGRQTEVHFTEVQFPHRRR